MPAVFISVYLMSPVVLTLHTFVAEFVTHGIMTHFGRLFVIFDQELWTLFKYCTRINSPSLYSL